jgi:hypothetical protein
MFKNETNVEDTERASDKHCQGSRERLKKCSLISSSPH